MGAEGTPFASDPRCLQCPVESGTIAGGLGEYKHREHDLKNQCLSGPGNRSLSGAAAAFVPHSFEVRLSAHEGLRHRWVPVEQSRV